jgi:hypothetical protein
MDESFPRNQENIPDNKSSLEIETDFFYNKWRNKFSHKEWHKKQFEYNFFHDLYNSKMENLYLRFPDEYNEMKLLEMEKDKLWNDVSNERERLEKEKPKADPLEILEMPSLDVLYEAYKVKRDNYDNSYRYFNNLLNENFPEEVNNAYSTREKYLEAINSDNNFYNKYLVANKAFSEIYDEYEKLDSSWYEDIVNIFSLEIDKYKRIKEDKLKKKLSRFFKESKFNPEFETRDKSLIGKQLLILNEFPNQIKKLMAQATIIAFSAIAISWAMKKDNQRIEDQNIKHKIDLVYNQTATQEVDSITNIILHDIAKDKELPKQWREFLAKEDSSEFYENLLREEYKNGKENISEDIHDILDSKISYIALLRMNEKYGKPKAKYGTSPGFHDRACYFVYMNTMYLPTFSGRFGLSDYLAELSHAVQYNGSERDKYLAWLDKDYNKTDSIAKKEGVDYDMAQLRTYEDKTTLEYEAHSIIEPKLIKEFEELKETIKEEVLGQDY